MREFSTDGTKRICAATSFIINIDVSVHEDTYVIKIGIIHDRKTVSCGVPVDRKIQRTYL